ncbi:MAG: DUF1570 domain-containing protein [Planctomycetota bacterium]
MVKTPLLHLTCVLFAAGLAILPAPAEVHTGPTGSTPPTTITDLMSGEGFEEARQMLASGDLEGAEAAAMAELSRNPYETEGYLLMFDIARAQPEPDVEAMLRWGKWLTWAYAASGNEAGLEVVSGKMTELYEDWQADTVTLGVWADGVAKAAKSATSKKQYRLAGHLLTKLLDLNPQDAKLAKTYEKLIDKAGNEVSGGAFVSDKVKRKSAKWLAKNNAKHSDWENRWEKKTKHYEIETNMDYEFFMTVCAAMDEMNAFYREIYDYKKKVPTARLAVHRKRSDFDRFSVELIGRPLQSESIGGYWVDGLQTVAVYDRSMGDPNQTRADLWNTLFHEASHQFMSLIMRKSTRKNYFTPSWLEEGAASYFEGCIIKADGTILKNNVAEHRLRSWWAIEQSGSRHSLEELIANIRNTGPDDTGMLSYEGTFYPYGWAFVYFLLNYEEGDRRVYAPAITPGEGIPSEYKAVRKAGKLVYRQAYLDYIEHFATVGNKNNDQYYPLEMAKKFFIEEIGDPDVPNWDAFEDRWRRFTNALYGEMLSGPEFADVLQARCRGYILAEDYERARTTAEQADEKRPNDAETFRLLAIANLGEGLEGDAVYWMTRHWERVWAIGDETAMAEAAEWLTKNGAKEIVKSYLEPCKAALAATKLDMERSLGDGHPVLATLYATHAMQAFQVQFPELIEQAKEMSEIAGQDLRVWQAAYNSTSDANRRATTDSGEIVDVVLYERDGVLVFNPEGWASPGMEYSTVSNLQYLTPPYSMRGTIQLEGSAAVIPMGIDNSGRARIWLVFTDYDAVDDVVLLKLVKYKVDARQGKASMDSDTVGGVRWERTKKIRFLLDVKEDGTGTIQINDDEAIPLPDEFKGGKMEGRFAITTDDGTAALFSNLEVRPSTAFWPVSHADEDEK